MMKYTVFSKHLNKDIVYTKEVFSDRYNVGDTVYLVSAFYGKFEVLGTMTEDSYKSVFNRLLPYEMYELEKPLVLVNSIGEVAIHFINLVDELITQDELDKLYLDQIKEHEKKIKGLKSRYRRLTGQKLEMKEV